MQPATIGQRALNMNGIMSMLQMNFGNAIYSQEIKQSFPEKVSIYYVDDGLLYKIQSLFETSSHEEMNVWYINQRMSDPS